MSTETTITAADVKVGDRIRVVEHYAALGARLAREEVYVGEVSEVSGVDERYAEFADGGTAFLGSDERIGVTVTITREATPLETLRAAVKAAHDYVGDDGDVPAILRRYARRLDDEYWPCGRETLLALANFLEETTAS